MLLPKQQRPGPRGFTLVELLTVMVVIGFLAGILMPRFARARFSAELSACQENLSNIGKAVQMYANENSQILPAAMSKLIASGGQQGFIQDRLICPSNSVGYDYMKSATDNLTYTITCLGNHSTTVSEQVSAGFPQYQSGSLKLRP